MSKKKTKLELVEEIFKPDKVTGISKWIKREYLNNTKLKLSTNGNIRQGIAYGVNKYIWQFKRLNDKTTGKILELRTNGFNNENNIKKSRPISKEVREYFKDKVCVQCGNSDTIPDHKNDLYNDPRVLNIKTQTINDFQPLCNSCNLRKRQVCKKMKETGKRYGATNLPGYEIDFISGDELYNENDINAMVGTYWYDIVEFRKQYLIQMIKKYKELNTDNTDNIKNTDNNDTIENNLINNMSKLSL